MHLRSLLKAIRKLFSKLFGGSFAQLFNDFGPTPQQPVHDAEAYRAAVRRMVSQSDLWRQKHGMAPVGKVGRAVGRFAADAAKTVRNDSAVMAEVARKTAHGAAVVAATPLLVAEAMLRQAPAPVPQKSREEEMLDKLVAIETARINRRSRPARQPRRSEPEAHSEDAASPACGF